MRLRPALFFFLAAAFGGAGDGLAGLTGTWGVPPKDGQPGVTGSYFNLYRDEGNRVHARLSLNPRGWSCTVATEVVWNPSVARFEWPNRAQGGSEAPCWLQGKPQGEGMDLRIFCPYECTARDVNTIALERVSPDRLSPPEHVVDTFCISHDTLRQETCRVGDIQTLIAEGNRKARQLGVLAEVTDNTPLIPETDRELLAILDRCRGDADGHACLAQALRWQCDRSFWPRQRLKELEPR
ncbi:MAG: hypothetical protein ABI672_17875 [Vicinamibacteria bacterium]